MRQVTSLIRQESSVPLAEQWIPAIISSQRSSVVSSLWPTKLPTQLGLVAFTKHFRVKSGTEREALYVFAIAIDVSSQLRQHEVVSFECLEAQVSKGAGSQIQQSCLVVLGPLSNCHNVQIDLAAMMKRAALTCQRRELRGLLATHNDNVNVRSYSREVVELRDDESAEECSSVGL